MHTTRPTPLRPLSALLILSIIGVAACSTAATPSLTTTTPSRAPLPAESAPDSAPSSAADSPEPSTEASADATAVPTSIDPCQLVSADEAGKLSGATFGAGKETTTKGNARICTYSGNTLNVFSVEVAIAPDEATAKADEAAAQADLQAAAAKLASHGATVTQLPGFAPGADAVLLEATISLGGKTLGGRGMYVLRGTTFFSFSDIAVDKAPPTADAMKAEAMTLLGRLP
jgi:hypothetical protein